MKYELNEGVMKSDMKLLFAGGFFTFGALTFVLAALTVKGYFERCKVDVLGLYIGILLVAIGIGIIAMIYRQKFGLWIIIPVLMIGAGMVQFDASKIIYSNEYYDTLGMERPDGTENEIEYMKFEPVVITGSIKEKGIQR